MRQSELFTKTRRETPADEVSKNAKLLVRGGFIAKEMAGVYSFLPLGLRVLSKIIGIVRREMDSIGGREVFLSALQEKEIWKKTDRWDDEKVDIWFKTKLRIGGELGLAFTHEEPLTRLMKEHIRSFRDLPAFLYQFQTKFRNETRAKSGILRTREFLMKDLYSFCRTKEEHEAFYDRVKETYRRIFKAVGLGDRTYLTFASGGSFSKYSHEFQTETEAGEDVIHLCEKCLIAVNDEIIKEQKVCPNCGSAALVKKNAVEVGNIFSLGTRFSEAFALLFLDEGGKRQPVIMGSYGIGPARVMGTVVETSSDERGIIWPASIAPFSLHLISVGGRDKNVSARADELYKKLSSKGVEVLYDDRDASAGEKFADADLLGIPLRVVAGKEAVEKGRFEIKDRKSGKVSFKAETELMKL